MGFVLEIQSPSPLTESTQSLQSSNKQKSKRTLGKGKKQGPSTFAGKLSAKRLMDKSKPLQLEVEKISKGKHATSPMRRQAGGGLIFFL